MSVKRAQTRLAPGTYRLQVDLPPLRSDKRRSSDWRYLPMLAGQLFFYTECVWTPNDDKPEVQIADQCIYPINKSGVTAVKPNETSATRQLEEALVRVEETATLYLTREHGGQTAMRVLDVLITKGLISLDEIMDIAQRIERE